MQTASGEQPKKIINLGTIGNAVIKRKRDDVANLDDTNNSGLQVISNSQGGG